MDVPRSVLEAGVRAYVDASGAWATEYPESAEETARLILDGPGTDGIMVNRRGLLAALAAAVEADRSLPVTGGPGAQ